MPYNNLLLFLVAIFLFTVTSGTGEPAFSFPLSLIMLIGMMFVYDIVSSRYFRIRRTTGPTFYFDCERKLTILALAFYGAALFVCDIHYYLIPLEFDGRFPSFVNIAGLAFFFLFLILMWRRAKPVYQAVIGRKLTATSFIVTNIRNNLPIVLPWIFLSISYDVIALLPIPQAKEFLHSEVGEYISFAIFLLLVLLFFPPIVRRLWACTPLPDGPLRDHLLNFFKRNRFSAQIFMWPLFEGRVITAGVMGVVPGLRYVMLTRALLENMTIAELDAVVAHEIGHVRRKHMLMYLVIIAGFSVIMGLFLEPFTFFLLSRDWYYFFLNFSGLSAENCLTLVVAILVLLLMILYFRYLFGFFIRNFERQADLHVFEVLGSSGSLVSAFEKIAVLSGNIRDLPSWHHFGIGQRVEFLEKCETSPEWVNRHHRKVRISLAVYLITLLMIAAGQSFLPVDGWKSAYEEKYTEFMLEQQLAREPQNALWLGIAGDLMHHKKLEKKAAAAYEKALEIKPSDPRLLNNFAWLLLTSDDLSIRDPERALDMARLAGMQAPAGHVLDTLATAYWANGFVEKAVQVERQAIAADPGEADYYRKQIDKFMGTEYGQFNNQ